MLDDPSPDNYDLPKRMALEDPGIKWTIDSARKRG